MLWQVTFKTKRPKGGVSKKPLSPIEGDRLTIGRGAGCDVPLPDVRVGLTEAELHVTGGSIIANQLGEAPLRINDTPTRGSAVKIGDRLGIGPYELTIVQPTEGADAAVEVEMVLPLGDDFARLQQQARIGLDKVVGKRPWAWAAFVLIAILFLALPIAAFYVNGKGERGAGPKGPLPAAVDLAWNSGEISNPHKNFAADCRQCHERPFVMVRDSSCLTCHSEVKHHADPKVVKVSTLDESRCASCHKEHNGAHGAILHAESLCTDCHTDLKRQAPETQLANVGAFGRAHPGFRVTVVDDPSARTVKRVAVGEKPQDNPRFNFSHERHMKETDSQGRKWPAASMANNRGPMQCVECHKTEPGGGYMVPITYAANCASCHDQYLRFDPAAAGKDRFVPHAQPLLAQRFIEDYYNAFALQWEPVPGNPKEFRRRPGTPLSPEERMNALALAKERTEEAKRLVFDTRGAGCQNCHVVTSTKSADGTVQYDIARPLLLASFMPKAKFSHAKHSTEACARCHDGVENSIKSSDVLLPAIESCQTCHGGENAGGKVQSTCISCHEFHRHDLGPMRTPPSAQRQTASGG